MYFSHPCSKSDKRNFLFVLGAGALRDTNRDGAYLSTDRLFSVNASLYALLFIIILFDFLHLREKKERKSEGE